MKNLSDFKNSEIQILFTDIDDTLTDAGQLGPKAFKSLWELSDAGIIVIPVTGRPAGWCEMIARFWPVKGVIGENGAFYFAYNKGKMKRYFFVSDEKQRTENRKKLDQIANEALKNIPGCSIASDQFCRLFDLAIDYCEDVPPLSPEDVAKITAVFKRHGAVSKVSSIHVNGWFGDYDKLTMCKIFLKNEFGIDATTENAHIAFVGDSPNDEPMFGFFENSFGVSNIKTFKDQLKTPPKYVSQGACGIGFQEIANKILSLKN